MPANDQRLYFLLQLTAHRLKKQADAAILEAADLSTSQVAVLTIIAAHQGVTQQFIADQLSQRESAVTTMADRLLKADYISRKRSKTDARAWELRATSKGQAALKKSAKPFSDINRILDDSLEPIGADAVAAALRTVLAALDN